MGIVRRIGRNLESTFSGLLDAAEDPAKSLEQTLRDLRAQLKLGRKELIRAVAAEKRLKESVATLTDEELKWERRAELAIRRSDDELARRALQQKRRISAEKDSVERTRQEQRAVVLELKQSLEQMERRTRDFEARKGTIGAKLSQSRPNAPGFGAAHAAVEAFDQIADQIDSVDDVVQAQREVDAMFTDSRLEEASLEARFRELEAPTLDRSEQPQWSGASDVDEELDALKQRMRVRV